MLRQIRVIRAIHQYVRILKQLNTARQLQHFKLSFCVSTKYHHRQSQQLGSLCNDSQTLCLQHGLATEKGHSLQIMHMLRIFQPIEN